MFSPSIKIFNLIRSVKTMKTLKAALVLPRTSDFLEPQRSKRVFTRFIFQPQNYGALNSICMVFCSQRFISFQCEPSRSVQPLVSPHELHPYYVQNKQDATSWPGAQCLRQLLSWSSLLKVTITLELGA